MTNYTPDYDAEDISGAVISGAAQGFIEAGSFVAIIMLLIVLGLTVAIWKKIKKG